MWYWYIPDDNILESYFYLIIFSLFIHDTYWQMIDKDNDLSSIYSNVVWNYSNAEIFQWTI